MKEISRSAIVSCSSEQMYQLVSDIASYDEFLPWCHGTTVQIIDDRYVRAQLKIYQSGIDLSFTTLNHNIPNESIEMELVDGPFKHLIGVWTFKSLGDQGCKVDLKLAFEMMSSLHSFATGKLFEKISSSLVDSFVKRAKQLYP